MNLVMLPMWLLLGRSSFVELSPDVRNRSSRLPLTQLNEVLRETILKRHRSRCGSPGGAGGVGIVTFVLR